MSTKRKSLRDFDDDAMAAPIAAPAPAAPAAAVEKAPQPPKKAPQSPQAARPTPKPAAAAAEARTATTTRTGIYFHPATFNDAKSAYLADLDNTGPDAADSIARWIAGALDVFAAGTTQERAQIAESLPAEARGEGSGFTRSFELPDDTIAARDLAITEDRRNGRTSSRSSFATEAIRHAIEQARARNGGVLPPAPDRLPNKPVR